MALIIGLILAYFNVGKNSFIIAVLVVGIVIGLLGIGMVSVTKLLHDRLLDKRKKQYSEKIFEISDSILNK